MDNISARDWFAGMALQGLLAGRYELTERGQSKRFIDDPEQLARYAYTIANEMVKNSASVNPL